MKITMLLPLLAVGIGGLFMCIFAGCKTSSNRVAASSSSLPASCTLMAMSPRDRAVHQNRLKTLRVAARFERDTPKGFAFAVDLRRMPATELDLWMTNEQGCCSFLRMDKRIDEAQSVAHINVECPPELRSAVMETFGLRK